MSAPRCVAPTSDDGEELCGAEATETRLVEGLECPLCKEHAAEIDRDRSEN